METLRQTLNRQQGVTIRVVTHETDIAAYASRVVTMRDGQILSDRRVGGIRPRQKPARQGQQPATFALFHPHDEAPLASHAVKATSLPSA